MPTTLSLAAYERLAAELDDLTTRGRVEIARKIEEARALGDLSENGDYHAAKDSQGHMETRIRQLEGLLKDAVVSDDVGDPDVVDAGSIVTLKYEGDDDADAEDYLVGSVEERRELPVISTASPLGKALQGRKAGPAPITYEAPNGQLTVYILRASGPDTVTVGGGDQVGLADRGMISDTVSAALVAADGTVDWWSPGRFDAPPLFTRLLEPAGSCLRVGPVASGRPPAGSQHYRDGTLVLVTRLSGRESLVEIEDLLAWDGGRPTGRLIRRLRVLRGPAEIAVEVVPTGDRRDISTSSEGVAFDGVHVRCGLPMVLTAVPPPAPAPRHRRLVATAVVTLDTGAGLVVTVDPAGLSEPPLSLGDADRLVERTTAAWRRLAGQVEVDGVYADVAQRSLLVASALAGTGGAPVASPVTSLPRVVGGERNTDGRIVSPVTAAAWASVAARTGLAEQAAAAVEWLAAALDHDPPLPSALAPGAGAPPSEVHLSGLAGWRRSQPVVAGTNGPDRVTVEPAAAAITAAANLALAPVGASALARWDRVVVHADWLADHWSAPDATVWDHRGSGPVWVAPRLAARRALDAAAASARRRHPLDLDAASWAAGAREIERWLVASGTAPDGVLRAAVDGAWTDAALVRVAAWGPWPAEDPVVNGTLDRVIERLGHGPWLYPWPAELDDGRPGAEPASVVATLWLARALALAGRWDEAHARMEAAVDLAGPLGLLPESVDATTGEPLGNWPASAAHVALVEAATALVSAPT